MSRTVVVTNARYRPFWADQLHAANLAALDAATASPSDQAAFLLAVDHVAAVARIIASLEGES